MRGTGLVVISKTGEETVSQRPIQKLISLKITTANHELSDNKPVNEEIFLFSPSTGKSGPEKTPYFDTFHAVTVFSIGKIGFNSFYMTGTSVMKDLKWMNSVYLQIFANQWTSFYVTGTSVMNNLKSMNLVYLHHEPRPLPSVLIKLTFFLFLTQLSSIQPFSTP